MAHQEFNADAITCLAQYASRALRSRRDTAELVMGTRAAIAQSQALIAKVDAEASPLSR